MPSLCERLGVNPPCVSCKCATFIHGPFCELTRGLIDCPHLTTAERKAVDEYARNNPSKPNAGVDEALEKAVKSLK